MSSIPRLLPWLCASAFAVAMVAQEAKPSTPDPAAPPAQATPGNPNAPVPPQEPGQPRRITLSVRDADLKDILRAATEDTDWNLSFESGLDLRVRGLDLKAVTLEEFLDDVLPGLGLGCARKGRTLHIHKAESALRFFSVDHLSLRRQGQKEFMVNASGQVVQAAGQGGGASGGAGGGGGQSGGGGQGGGHSSAYTSTLTTGNAFDPWQELQAGLTTLVFGEPSVDPSSSQGGQPAAPSSRAFARNGKSLLIQPDSGLVVVSADPYTQNRVEKYLGEVQRRNRRQVLLEAKIVEVTLGNDSQIGVDWNGLLTPGGASGWIGTDIRGTLQTGDTLNDNVSAASQGLAKLVIQNARVTATLSALAREGRLQVLSAPRISTLNNQKAILRVVREEAFFLQNSQVTPGGSFGAPIATVQITPVVVPVGIVLDIQPQVGDDGAITLAVNPSVSEIVTVRSLTVNGGFSGGSGGASATLPVVDRRDLDTVVRMRSGETLVLAGIIRVKESEDDRGVPWLRKVPGLGQLFSKREKQRVHTELAIFITPTLVEESAQVNAQRINAERRLGAAGVQMQPEPRKGSTIKDP